MGKQELLAQVSQLASTKTISKKELLDAYEKGLGGSLRHFSLSHILYYVGGFIVLLGIGVLLWQNWDSLSVATRILVTFGTSIAAYVVAVLLSRYDHLDEVSQAFHIISAFTLPVGLFIIFDNAGLQIDTPATQSLVSAILLLAYLASLWVFHRNIFIVFSVLAATWLYYSFASFLTEDYQGGLLTISEFYEYLTLIAGAAWVALGYSFAQTAKRGMSDWLYGLGTAGFLGAAMALGGWAPEQNSFWEVIFPGIAFGAIFLSIYLKSRVLLVLSVLYLMAYILKLTSEYFSENLGWALALVIVGFVLIGLGYGAFWLNKKYLS